MVGRLSKTVWTTQFVLWVIALFSPCMWASVAALLWFVVWETKGVWTKRGGDTLSESCWRLLDVEDNKPTYVALYYLVMGWFASAAWLFIGVVAWTNGGFELDASGLVFTKVMAALSFCIGVMAFLFRHMRRGDSR